MNLYLPTILNMQNKYNEKIWHLWCIATRVRPKPFFQDLVETETETTNFVVKINP